MLLQNLRFGLRMVRRSPIVSVSAILAAGLGIGASSAMFSIVDGVLLRPLPFAAPQQLVNVWASLPVRQLPTLVAAPANYYDWREQNHVLSAMGAYQPAAFGVTANGGEPVRYLGAVSDPEFFATLRVKPFLGRMFTEDEMEPGRDTVILLGYGLWQQRFGADPGALGASLEINGQVRRVIGVMPRGFEYPAGATMWGPLPMNAETRARRDFHMLRAIGRLKDGVTLRQARAEFRTIAARLADRYPDLDKDEGIVVNPVLDDLVGTVRPALMVLAGAVAFVLLIACANIANLLLARASGRQREMAIRTSLGANRAAILAQMLTESVILALLGGAAGLALTAIGFRGLLRLAPPNVPRLEDVALNWRVIELSLGLSLLTGLLFGLAPAWHAARIDVNAMLKQGSRGTSARGRLRSWLLAGQIAVALVLLTGAGLLLRSFYEIAHVEMGFLPDRLMTMQLQPTVARYANHEDLQIQLARGIVDKVSALPGVRVAGITNALPLLGNPIYIMRFEGRPPLAVSQAPVVNFFAVTPGFFGAMGMRIVRGRPLEETDLASAPLVAVVNQTMVERFFPGKDPIGKRLEIGFSTPPQWRQIVGVVADVKTAGLDRDTPVQVYTAFYQQPGLVGVSPLTVLARTAGEPAAMAAPMKAAILSVDRSQPVFAVQPMTEVVADSIAQRRIAFILLAFFAGSALVLASIGVYGIMSYLVTQRTGEIGLRMALGAGAGNVALLVGRQGMALVAAGLATGLVGSLLLTRWMAPLLFRVNPRDPLIFGIAIGTLVAVSAAACFVPARRAAMLDPLVALRSE
ncbi:MAG TPA: ABC transporter permease [Bryobacteraceae bacterium]|nr:ABC transporter permease [Bryobacteraceae bacterium]